MLAVIGEHRGVVAVLRGESLHPRAIQFHGEQFFLPRISLIGGKENRARRLVHTVNRKHLILPGFELAFEFGIGSYRIGRIETVEINMGVSVAPTGPQKASVRSPVGFQDAKIVVDLDPGVGLRFGEHFARLA